MGSSLIRGCKSPVMARCDHLIIDVGFGFRKSNCLEILKIYFVNESKLLRVLRKRERERKIRFSLNSYKEFKKMNNTELLTNVSYLKIILFLVVS